MCKLVLHVLTPDSFKSIDKWQRNGHFIAFGPGFTNDTWAYWLDLTAIATPNTACAFMIANFKFAAWPCDCSCPKSLPYVLQTVPLVYSILQDLIITLPSCSFAFGGHKAHIQYWLLQSVLIQSIGLDIIFFKTWSTSIEMTTSLAFSIYFNEWGVTNKLIICWQPSFPSSV